MGFFERAARLSDAAQRSHSRHPILTIGLSARKDRCREWSRADKSSFVARSPASSTRSGELPIQVIDIGRFRAIRPTLDELDAARALGSETLAVLSEVATPPLVRGDRRWGLAELLRRILNHPELEVRTFLAPAEVDGVIEGLVHALCFENGRSTD